MSDGPRDANQSAWTNSQEGRALNQSVKINTQTTMKCDGCDKPIYEGMHYITVHLELQTLISGLDEVELMTLGLPDPTAFDIVTHNPECISLWGRKNPLILDVFAR